MVQIAMLVLAPTLGFFVGNRRVVNGVLVGVWAALMAFPQTHAVLLDDQLDKRSYGNTAGYFVVNYITLAAAVGLAAWIAARRARSAAASKQIAAS